MRSVVVRRRNVLKRNSMRFAPLYCRRWPALSPVRTQFWLPHPSTMIRCRASTG